MVESLAVAAEEDLLVGGQAGQAHRVHPDSAGALAAAGVRQGLARRGVDESARARRPRARPPSRARPASDVPDGASTLRSWCSSITSTVSKYGRGLGREALGQHRADRVVGAQHHAGRRAGGHDLVALLGREPGRADDEHLARGSAHHARRGDDALGRREVDDGVDRSTGPRRRCWSAQVAPSWCGGFGRVDEDPTVKSASAPEARRQGLAHAARSRRRCRARSRANASGGPSALREEKPRRPRPATARRAAADAATPISMCGAW